MGSPRAHTDEDESWMAVEAKGGLCPQVRPHRLAHFSKMSGTGSKSRESGSGELREDMVKGQAELAKNKGA